MSSRDQWRKWLGIFLRTLAWIGLGLVVILVLVILLLGTGWGNNLVRKMAVSYLQDKLHTDVRIDGFRLHGLHGISLQGVLIRDQQKDTLLGLDSLDLAFEPEALLAGTVNIKNLSVAGLTAKITRKAGGDFSFQFIPDAFSSGEATPDTSSGKPWAIEANLVRLRRVAFLWDDQQSGDYYRANWKDLGLEIAPTDLTQLHYDIRDGRIDGADIDIRLGSSETPDKPAATASADSSTLDILAARLLLKDTRFRLRIPADSLLVESRADSLLGQQIVYDGRTSLVSAGLLSLNGHRTEVRYRSSAGPAATTPDPPAPGAPISIRVDSIAITRTSLAAHDIAYPKIYTDRFDPHHIGLDSLRLLAANLRYDSAGYRAGIREFHLRDQNGFLLKQAKADAVYSDTGLSLQGLVLETRQNSLKGAVRMRYTAPGEIMDRPAQTFLDARVDPLKLKLDELTYFAPDLRKNKSIAPLLRKTIDVNLEARGTLAKLTLPTFRIATDGNLVRGGVTLLNPTQPDKLQADLRLAELRSSRKDLKALLPPGMLPDSVWAYVPERFTMQGTLDASMSRVRPNLTLNSTYGDLTLRGFIEHPTDKMRARYDLDVVTRHLALGSILRDTSMGSVSAHMHANGRGFDLKTAVADLDAHIDEAYYRGYTYHQADLKGQVNQGRIDAQVQSEDPNADLDLDLGIRIGNSIDEIRTKGDIRNIDLRRLGLYNDTLAIRGNVDIDFPSLDSANLQGKALITGLSIDYGRTPYLLDTIQTLAHVENDTQYITIRSPLLDASIKGQFSFDAIPATFQTILQNYMVTTGETRPFDRQLFVEIRSKVHIPDSLAPVIPGLKKVSPFEFFGRMNTASNNVLTFARIAELQYADYTVDSILLAIAQDTSRPMLRKAGFVARFKQASFKGLTVEETTLQGNVDKGTVMSELSIKDKTGSNKYLVRANYYNDSARPYAWLSDTLLLNKTRWKVNPENKIYLRPNQIRGSNLEISQGNEMIAVHADETAPDGLPMRVSIDHFHLESLAGMVISDTTGALIRGEVNGHFTLESTSPLRFRSDAGIGDLGLLGIGFGNLNANLSTGEDNRYNLDLTLQGEGNDVKAKGYFGAPDGSMDLQVNLHPLSLRPAGIFVAKYLDSLRGGISGDLRISGDSLSTQLNGQLRIDSTFLIARQTGTILQIPQAQFGFNGRDIVFEGMDIQDSAGRKASITGDASLRNLSEISYDLKLNAPAFLVSGKKRYPDQLISGPLNAALLLNVKGNTEGAAITGSINVLDGSEISYVYQSDVSSVNGEGLIEFFDPSKKPDSLAVANGQRKKASLFDLSVNTTINLTEKSTANVILDEYSGDKVQAKGKAALNFSLEPTGEMELTGNYEVVEGKYNMTIAGLMKKEFMIQKGSTIAWSGDIMDANTNLTALYKVKTDAEELVQDMGGDKTAAKQKLDFEVYMMLKGELMKPNISFRLDMAEKEQGAMDGMVYTRIKQINTIPSELNKQVMGLLAMNSFIADNPFNSMAGSGGNFETQAFNTAGRLLTQELNDFIGNMVKDVDIDVGLDIRDDYSSGSAQRRSDLKVGIAKSFGNNRLNIYVGNTFALENHNQEEDLLSGLAGDVNIEYLLTTDGRYRLKGFRQTQEDLTFNGIVVETGVSFMVVLEFNKLKNALQSKKNKQKKTVKP